MKLPAPLMAIAFCTGLATLALSAANAQDYPNRAVRVVVPYAPGGVPDIIARLVAVPLTKQLGKPFVIENKPGGSGIVAVQDVLRSPPDGYTILMSDIQQLAINPYLMSQLPYDPANDFDPITLAATVPLYIAVQSSLNVNTLGELVALAKTKPGEINYGSSGTGSIHHLTMEALKAGLGINLTHVPYRGAAQSVPAFLRGDTELVIATLSGLLSAAESGKIRLLGVTTLKRMPETPGVPAVSETIAGFDFSSEMGFALKAGSSADVVQKLSREIVISLSDPEIAKGVKATGVAIIGSDARGYRENIRQNLIKFERTIKAADVKIN